MPLPFPRPLLPLGRPCSQQGDAEKTIIKLGRKLAAVVQRNHPRKERCDSDNCLPAKSCDSNPPQHLGSTQNLALDQTLAQFPRHSRRVLRTRKLWPGLAPPSPAANGTRISSRTNRRGSRAVHSVGFGKQRATVRSQAASRRRSLRC